jgi:hypothetical protein
MKYTVPFTILIDTAETHPFEFLNIHGFKGRPNWSEELIVSTKWQCLGRYPNSLGDYAIEGMESRCHIERKSVEDAQSTVLGWESQHERNEELSGLRDRFEKELENLEKVEAALVVVEGSLGHCLETMPEWGDKDSALNAKIFYRSVLAYMQDYRVNWLFADGRRLAEIATYRFLERFWKRHQSD